MNIILVDAFDSFVWIIDQYLQELGATTEVIRSSPEVAGRIASGGFDGIVLGPGPGSPEESGHVELIHQFAGKLPILGVCLGHQAIATAYGAVVKPSGHVRHGKTSMVTHDGRGVFAGIQSPVEVARYHSLIVDPETVPDELEVSATSTDDGFIMGIRHRSLPLEGVQFHPESIGTTDGARYLRNFLDSIEVVG